MNYKTFRILLILYMALILTLSSLPAQALPKTWLLNWDKLIHLIQYFILGVLAMKSLKKININSVILVIIFGLIFGSIDEFLQSFISGRFSSALDVLADTIGTAIGALLVSGTIDT
tara:strand:+ start:1415 stop:1762 length:348 start_codon:yes stop_codon:yes gene_type:complete